MDSITRRRFLAASGCAGVAAATVAATGFVSWPTLAGRAVAAPLPSSTPILVIVTLYGGNDGLNMVVPYSDPAYRAARPDFAYGAADVLKLDGDLGLNPAMKGLAARWTDKQLAVVRGVGYPDPDHSHFRSMDIWQTASPSVPVNTGWIGRWLDQGGDDPIRAISLGSTLPPLAVGSRTTAASLPIGRTTPLPVALAAALDGLGRPDPDDSAAQALVAASYHDDREVAGRLAPVTDPAKAAGGAGDEDENSGAVGGGQSDLARQLDLVARCIKAGVPTTVYSASLGGFDTHAGEKATQQTQLGLLDTALDSFHTTMAGHARAGDVVVLVYSEFGRRVKANASEGTDHGTAGPVLLLGPSVRGGFFGEQPSLTDLADGDLKVTVDFRTVYAELLTKVVRTDPEPVLGSTAPALGLLA